MSGLHCFRVVDSVSYDTAKACINPWDRVNACIIPSQFPCDFASACIILWWMVSILFHGFYSVWTLDQMSRPTNGSSTTHKTFHDNTCPASMWMALGVGIWMNNIGVYVEYKWAGVGIPSHICSHAPTTSKPVTLHTWAMIGDDHDSNFDMPITWALPFRQTQHH